MRRVVFFGSSHKVGVTNQLSEQGILLSGRLAQKFLFISGEKEQFPGLFEKLQGSHVNYVTIDGLDEHNDFFRLVREFIKCVRQFRPDVIHCHTNWQLAISVICKHFAKKDYSIFYTVHGYRHNYRYRSKVARYLIGLGLLAFADKVITPSSFLKRQFSFLDGKTHLLFLGLEDALFNSYKSPVFEEAKRIIFAGEFRHGKNQEVLIRAIKKYIGKTGDVNVELYLPGVGPKLERCREMVSQLNLAEKVFFPGFVERKKMVELYLRCQYAVVPSNVETFGYCITEPFALGRVVISRRVGVADDIIIHGENGFLFDTEEELIELLVEILPDEGKSIQVARKAFEGRDVFRWSNLTEKYLALIDGSYPS